MKRTLLKMGLLAGCLTILGGFTFSVVGQSNFCAAATSGAGNVAEDKWILKDLGSLSVELPSFVDLEYRSGVDQAQWEYHPSKRFRMSIYLGPDSPRPSVYVRNLKTYVQTRREIRGVNAIEWQYRFDNDPEDPPFVCGVRLNRGPGTSGDSISVVIRGDSVEATQIASRIFSSIIWKDKSQKK